jgi:flagellar hook-basal body complex protein FliE
MAIDAVSVSGLMPSQGANSAGKLAEAANGSSSSGAFPGMLNQLLQNVAHSHATADTAVQDLALGQTDNLHAVMLQMAQADLTFHLVLEIRNRLTEAYQDIMKMQI